MFRISSLRPIAWVVCCLHLFASPVLAEAGGSTEQSRSERALERAAIGLDVVVVRPLSFAAVAVGAGFFVIAAPFAALGDRMGATYDVFLQVPIDYAWWRPLGDL